MGHERQGARSHYSYDSETIQEAYVQAFEFLSVNGLQSREDLKNLKVDMEQKLGQLTLENMKTREEQQTQIETLRKEMKLFTESFQLVLESHRKEREASTLFNLDNPTKETPEQKAIKKQAQEDQEKAIKKAKKLTHKGTE